MLIKSDIHFYCTNIFDLKYISSTIEACVEIDLKVSLSIQNLKRRNFSQIQQKLRRNVLVFKHEKLRKPLNTRLVVTPSSGVTKNLAKITTNIPLIHMPHSLASLTAIYPIDAFDEYDYIFACGVHHIEEYQEVKNARHLNGEVLPVGYGFFDELNRAKSKIRLLTEGTRNNRCLIAPSWNDNSFLDSIGGELIEKLIKSGDLVTLRPHPLYISKKFQMKKFYKIESMFPNFKIENPFKTSISEILHADILIGDYSGTSFEFAKLNRKPVISIDTPIKSLNSDWEKRTNLPIELKYRNSIGVIVKPIVSQITNVYRNLKTYGHQDMNSLDLINSSFFEGNPEISDNALFYIKRILDMQ